MARQPGTRRGALAELIEISHAVGRDPDLVQGGGGNTSVKSRDGTRLFVKASGTPLGEMDRERGWAEMDLARARGLLDEAGLAGLPEVEREREVLRRLQAGVHRPVGARPSVETSLHALMDRVVIHTHPVGLNAFLCSQNSRQAHAELLGGPDGPPLYIPYTDPGFTLAVRFREESHRYAQRYGRSPRVVLLENHGLFVAAGDVAECLDLTRRITRLGQDWIGGERINPLEFPRLVEPDPARGTAELRGALLRAGCRPGLLRRDREPVAAELLKDSLHVSASRRGAFTPDQIVYCRRHPLVLSPRRARGATPVASWARRIAAYRDRHGLDPRVIVIPGDGIYYSAAGLSQLRVIGEVFRSAIAAITRTGKGGGPRFLTAKQAGFIERWEVESFRGSLQAGRVESLTGRVVVVTGAGGEIGAGVVGSLLDAGATVAGLDRESKPLRRLEARAPQRRFLAVPVELSEEDGVARAFARVEASLGGMDCLAHCADTRASPPLLETSLEEWEESVARPGRIRFLCLREAARILGRQGAGGAVLEITCGGGVGEGAKAWDPGLGAPGIRFNRVVTGSASRGGDPGGAVVFLLSEAGASIAGQTLRLE